MNKRPVLMTAEHPDGWKLEELLHALVEELEAKTDNLNQFGTHPTASNYRRSNAAIVDHLLQAASVQELALKFAKENPLTDASKVPVVDIIYATSKNGIIGADNTIPWKCSADMRHFKETTMGHTVVMGYNTYLSFNGRPLPKRDNYVIVDPLRISDKQRSDMEAEGFKPIKEIDLFPTLVEVPAEKIFVIGGTKTYRSFNHLHTSGLVRINSIISTVIDTHVSGDAIEPIFPGLILEEQFDRRVLEKQPGEEDQPTATVLTFKVKG